MKMRANTAIGGFLIGVLFAPPRRQRSGRRYDPLKINLRAPAAAVAAALARHRRVRPRRAEPADGRRRNQRAGSPVLTVTFAVCSAR
jgi:hypothetical protein